MRTLRYQIAPEHEGMNVERYLKQQHGYSSRTIVKLKHYEQGMRLNGAHTRTIDLLHAGDVLEITFLDSEEHGVEHFIRSNRQVEIAYEDDDLLVFNKPADMPCHQSCGHAADTLANVFAAHCDQLGMDLMYRPLNRLDRDTSGAVLIAKNRFAAASVTNNFHKTYQADFVLETGRTHQIRVHMAHLGCPVLGDIMYGRKSEMIARQALHCRYIAFTQPVSRQPVGVRCTMPEDMQEVCTKLGLKMNNDV